MDTNRAILALVLPFGARNAADDREYEARDVLGFVAAQRAVPINFGHRSAMERREVLGAWRRFAVVGDSTVPPGLLAIGQFERSPTGVSLLETLLEPSPSWGMPARWGVSAGLIVDDRTGEVLDIEEVSVCPAYDPDRPDRPGHAAFEDALVIAVGPKAASGWELLTGMELPTVTKTGERTVTGRAFIAPDGRVRRESWVEEF